jgi:O-methyltransferase
MSASSVSGESGSMGGDVGRIIRENDRLTKEVRELTARVAAVESSRWWRLHPRVALEQLRGRVGNAGDAAAVEQEPPRAHAFPLDFEQPDIELCLRVAPYTMTTPARIYSLVRAVEYVVGRTLPGALVECGVWRGGSMMAAALTLLRLGVTDRDLYLFDTFTGMTAPSNEDVKRSGERAADLLAEESPDSDIWAIAPIDEVRKAVLGVGYPEERIHFVQGPVEETLPAHAPDEIALLRLDTDWYSSTKHELVHLYPRLISGGILILDDYGYWQGARRAVDEYISENGLTLLLNRIDNTARSSIKP